jgi:copper resistance protein C
MRLAPAEPARSSKHSVKLAAIVAFVLALAPMAHAHSLLLSSVPRADAVVNGAPAVTLRFNNRIEKKLSQIRLVSPRGEPQPLIVRTDGAVDALEAPLPALAAGRYRVDWRVLSTDGHVVSGTFAFSVSP